MNIHRRHLNCCILGICILKKQGGVLILERALKRMGGGLIFLKTFRDTLFNVGLSNKPNFAGQYL